LGSTPAIRSLGAVTDKQMIVGDLRVDERLGAELLDQRNDRRDRAPFRALCYGKGISWLEWAETCNARKAHTLVRRC
jgi:hypothetical protein